MGVTADFTLVSREQYARVLTDKNAVAVSELQVYFDVGKSWVFFNEVFESFGEPLNKVFEGDYLPDGFWGLCGGQGHFGYISPELASAIGQALVAVEPEHIFARAAELGITLDSDREKWYPFTVGFYPNVHAHALGARGCLDRDPSPSANELQPSLLGIFASGCKLPLPPHRHRIAYSISRSHDLASLRDSSAGHHM